MPRGGRREGRPGKAYAARTDLQAVKVAPSKQYGQAAAQAAAQRAVPLAGATSPGPMPTGGAPAAGAPAPRPMPGVMPGAVTPLDAPTQRPSEPLTAGMPMGPGAGPEALGALAPRPENGVADLAPYLPVLEFMASRPNATSQTRNLVRRLRASTPTAQ